MLLNGERAPEKYSEELQVSLNLAYCIPFHSCIYIIIKKNLLLQLHLNINVKKIQIVQITTKQKFKSVCSRSSTASTFK